MKDSIISKILTQHNKTTIYDGNLLRSDFCPCCGYSEHKEPILLARKEDGRESWQCLRCNENGDLPGFIVSLKGISLNEALKEISQEFEDSSLKLNISNNPSKQEAVEKVIQLFKKNLPKTEADGESYFFGLGITPSTLFKLKEREMIGFLPGGRDWKVNQAWLEENIGLDLMLEAGLQNPDKKISGLAFRSVIFFLPRDKSFEAYAIDSKPGMPKVLRYGTTVAPYWWKAGVLKHNDVWVVSGIVEFLNVLQNNPCATVLGLPGDNNGWKPDWIGALKKTGKHLKLVCAFKDNTAGNKAASKLEVFCTGADIRYNRFIPSSI